MNLSPADRVALILGRAIIRAEGLEAALQEAQARLVELEAEKNGKPAEASVPAEA